MLRLDKYISQALVISRKDATLAIKKGRVTVNGEIIKKADIKVNPDADNVAFDGEKISYSEFIYIMLNKPKGLVCASEDRKDNTVISLFPVEYTDKGISCVGRLDKDTTGILIVTNDGALAHKLLSPKSHKEKIYYVASDKPFTEADKETMLKGIVIEGKNTAPAKLSLIDGQPMNAYVTLTEGKFHEVKRLCYACGEKEVLELKRTEFCGLKLDESLDEGEWRNLTPDEIEILMKQ
ncbi:MAG: rRNA pseudouridine synthase [Clostridia bacterium]|nr:rRNA pseudouridine synthase [Clostridia bacterium]